MNAGAYGGEMKDVVTAITAMDQAGMLFELTGEQAAFGYRTSRFVNGEIVCAVTLSLTPGNAQEIDAQMKEIFQRRVDKQPLEWPSAGSAFKRPPNGFAAALIDECGLKGFTVGGEQVSEKHAGFVIHRGGASCAELLQLLEQVQVRVQEAPGSLLAAGSHWWT